MTTWPVVIEDWQHECCGDPTAIGSVVHLLLRLDPAGRADGLDAAVATIDGPRERLDDEWERIRLPGLDVHLRREHGWPAGPLRGVLVDESHGDVPEDHEDPNAAVVRRIRVLTHVATQTRFRRAVEVVAGSTRAHEVEAVPDVFRFWPPTVTEPDPAGQEVAFAALLDVEAAGS